MITLIGIIIVMFAINWRLALLGLVDDADHDGGDGLFPGATSAVPRT